jgi:predicted transcriptional regulator of viral defense system
MSAAGRDAGPVLEEIRERQHGVITRSQALVTGLTTEQIRARLTSGRWQRVFRSVYATFNGPLPRQSVLWAAVLQAGPRAALSHESAAELIGLAEAPHPVVHVTVPSDRRVSPMPGTKVHYASRVDRARHPSRLPPQTRVEEP